MGYPTSLDNLPSVNSGDLISASGTDAQITAINAIEAALGVTPYSVWSTVAAAIVSIAGKMAVRLTTAASLASYTVAGNVLTASSNAALSIDSVSVGASDRILVMNETGGNEPNNGIYTVTATGSGSAPWVLTRATDMSVSSQVPGVFVYTREGTANAGCVFAVTGATSSFVLGTTNMTWGLLAGPPGGILGVVSGGTGASLSAPALGTILSGTGSVFNELAVGTNGFALVADSTQTLGIHWGNPHKLAMATKTGNYAIASTDTYIRVDASSNNVTITLPDATTLGSASANMWFEIKRIDGSGHTVTINTTSSQTIDGVTSKTLSTQYATLRVMSNNSNWDVI